MWSIAIFTSLISSWLTTKSRETHGNYFSFLNKYIRKYWLTIFSKSTNTINFDMWCKVFFPTFDFWIWDCSIFVQHFDFFELFLYLLWLNFYPNFSFLLCVDSLLFKNLSRFFGDFLFIKKLDKNFLNFPNILEIQDFLQLSKLLLIFECFLQLLWYENFTKNSKKYEYSPFLTQNDLWLAKSVHIDSHRDVFLHGFPFHGQLEEFS